jgi:IclR family transcriptional regulator, pca regulon regulatory protein
MAGGLKKLVGSRAESSKSSLARGLAVFERFTPENKSYTLSELSMRLEVPKSSLYRIVKELVEMNYLRYEEQSKRYYLGTKVLSLGFSVLQGMELRDIARPYLEKLSRECNKTVNLAVFDRDEMVYVERIRVPGIRTYNISVGGRMSPWDTAVGKVVLAHLPAEKLGEMLKKLRSRPELSINENEVMNELDEVRKDGFALHQEFKRGFLAVAVPVFSAQGVACAVNMIAEVEDATLDTLKAQYAPRLITVGRELSKALGHRV